MRCRAHASVALDQALLHFDRAAHSVDNAAELDDAAVARALDDAAVVHGDCGIDQIAAQCSQSRKSSVFVRAGKPAVADHIRDQDRSDFPGLAHGARCRRPSRPFQTIPATALGGERKTAKADR